MNFNFDCRSRLKTFDAKKISSNSKKPEEASRLLQAQKKICGGVKAFSNFTD